MHNTYTHPSLQIVKSLNAQNALGWWYTTFVPGSIYSFQLESLSNDDGKELAATMAELLQSKHMMVVP